MNRLKVSFKTSIFIVVSCQEYNLSTFNEVIVIHNRAEFGLKLKLKSCTYNDMIRGKWEGKGLANV